VKIAIHAEARDEFFRAIEYYENQNKGLGIEFIAKIEEAIARIVDFPYAWSRLGQNLRKCLLKKFP